MKKTIPLLMVVLLILGNLLFADSTPTQLPVLEAPVLIVSAGQSPGALQFSVVAKMAKLPHQFEKLLKAEDFDPTKYKTLVLVVGASSKGLGAAGIDIEEEVKRVIALAEKAKANKIPVVICHLEGGTRRGPMSDRILDALAPYASIFLVKTDSDKDGKFKTLSENLKVPIVYFEKTSDLKGIIQQYFIY
ncbi:MAG: hypothetical protein PWP37_625 [Thermotogota bacterium]|nr:hypothetical protein [Thermotogota bacterium]MDK2864433.1 hypothetical protein [Thermotogota bacterium]HCZ05537.1 hypothetical protein [Thermotogota bacterium]